MCDERERLLDYLYDVCDAEERRRVEAHVSACDECRAEIAGLRGVREDLLAWAVPDHGSVWTPFAPPRAQVWWRQMPVWALATAASLVFMLGLAGGFAARQFAPARAAVSAAAPAASAAATVSPADLAAFEQRVLGEVQSAIDANAKPAQAQPQLASLSSADRDQLLRQMRQLIAASENRQQQARDSTMRVLLQDSENTYLRKARFNQLQYQVSQVLQQQGGR